MKPFRSFALGAVLAFGGAACGSHPMQVSTEITTAGGTVQTTDGTAVSIPAGALSQPTTITITTESNSVSIAGQTLIGDTYRFGPEGLQFAMPVLLTIALDPSKLPTGTPESDVVVMTAPVGSMSFTPLSTHVFDASHVRAQTSHFSDFVATVSSAGPLDQSVAVFDAGSESRDLSSSIADLETAGDLEASCPLTWNDSTCSLSASASQCGGGTFNLNCQQTFCICNHANQPKQCQKAAPDTGTTNCPSQAAVETIWTTCCGYPL